MRTATVRGGDRPGGGFVLKDGKDLHILKSMGGKGTGGKEED